MDNYRKQASRFCIACLLILGGMLTGQAGFAILGAKSLVEQSVELMPSNEAIINEHTQ